MHTQDKYSIVYPPLYPYMSPPLSHILSPYPSPSPSPSLFSDKIISSSPPSISKKRSSQEPKLHSSQKPRIILFLGIITSYFILKTIR